MNLSASAPVDVRVPAPIVVTFPDQTTRSFPAGVTGAGLAQAIAKSLANLLSRHVIVPLIGQSAANGALPTLYAATCPSAKGGELYGPTGFMEMKGAPGRRAFAEPAKDPAAASRLWGISEELVQTRFGAARARTTQDASADM